MARRTAARTATGGGEGIPASRQVRARVALSLASLVAQSGLAAVFAARAERVWWLPAALGAGAVLLLAVGLAARRAGALPWSLALLGAAYSTSLALGPAALDAWAPVYAAGVVAAAELADWALDTARPAPGEPLRRALATLALCAVGLVVGAVVLAVSAASVSGGPALEAVGVAAAAAALALAALLARRERAA